MFNPKRCGLFGQLRRRGGGGAKSDPKGGRGFGRAPIFTCFTTICFFVNGTFIMPQKKPFAKKKFWISCSHLKVPFWQNGKIAKMALLNRCKKFKKIFGKKTSFEALWKCHLQKIFITFSRVRQIEDLGQSKYKPRLFSKRTHGISKILFNLGSCKLLARKASKIRKCLFFDGSLL